MMTANGHVPPAVAALAGRRIDMQHAGHVRFPLAEDDKVFEKIIRRFRKEQVKHLVCSAACGADILALEVANKISIPATIILPFAPHIFREISVTDRPGNWGERFDRILGASHGRNDIIVLGLGTDDEHAFSKTNSQIIHSTLISRYHRKLAFVVWEGKSRGKDDSTAEFINMALSKGLEKMSVLTTRRVN